MDIVGNILNGILGSGVEILTKAIGFLLSAIFGVVGIIVFGFITVLGQISNSLFSATDLSSTMFESLFGTTTANGSTQQIVDIVNTDLVYIGIAAIFALFLIALCRNLFSGVGFTPEDPIKMVVRFFIAVFFVLNIHELCVFIMESCFSIPYTHLVTDGGTSNFWSAFNWNNLASLFTGSSQITTNFGLGNPFFQSFANLIVPFVVLVIIVSIGINYFKLILEAVERYVLTNIVIMASPLAASSLVLESTQAYFKNFMKMFIGQLILLCANGLMIALANTALGIVLVKLPENNVESLVLALMLLAFLRVAQHLDNYLKDLGMNAGITGGSMIDEIVSTAGLLKGGKDIVTKMNPSNVSAGANAFKSAFGAASTAGATPFSGVASAAASNAAETFGRNVPSAAKGAVQTAAWAGSMAGSLGGMGKRVANAVTGNGNVNPFDANGAFNPHEKFNTGAAATAQADAFVGRNNMDAYGVVRSSVQAAKGGYMGSDTGGGLHAFFKDNPSSMLKPNASAGAVSPITGPDGSQYYHVNVDDLNDNVSSALQGYHQCGVGTMNASDIASGIPFTPPDPTNGGSPSGIPFTPPAPTSGAPMGGSVGGSVGGPMGGSVGANPSGNVPTGNVPTQSSQRSSPLPNNNGKK